MRTKPDPGVYILTFPDFDPPWQVVITIDEDGGTVSPVHVFEWADDPGGPILRCGRHVYLGFTPPDQVDLVAKDKNGNVIAAVGGTYAPA